MRPGIRPALVAQRTETNPFVRAAGMVDTHRFGARIRGQCGVARVHQRHRRRVVQPQQREIGAIVVRVSGQQFGAARRARHGTQVRRRAAAFVTLIAPVHLEAVRLGLAVHAMVRGQQVGYR